MDETILREIRVTNPEECPFRGCDDVGEECLLPPNCVCEDEERVPNGPPNIQVIEGMELARLYTHWIVIFPSRCPFGGKPFIVRVTR